MKRLILASALALTTTSAIAQNAVCDDQANWEEALTAGGFVLVATPTVRMPNANGETQIWVNYSAGNWIMLAVNPNDVSCVALLGTDWTAEPRPQGTAL